MQLLPPLGADARDWSREAPAGAHLPYLAQIDDSTILLRDGRLMQVLTLDGLLFETADSDEINYRKAMRDAMLQAIGSPQIALYHHVIRRRVEPQLDAAFPDAFSRQVDRNWRERLRTKRLFRNDLFVAIIRRIPPERGGFIEKLKGWLGGGLEGGVSDLTRDRRELEVARNALLASLSQYRPRVLGCYDLNSVLCSEPLEYLSSLYNAELRPIGLPESDLGEYLPYRRVSFGAQTLELSAAGDMDRAFAGLVSIKAYPGQTSPGTLDDVLRLPHEMVVTQSFGFVDRQTAAGRINRSLRRMRAADDEALSLRGELATARDDVAAGRAGFGEHHLTIAVRGGSPAEVDEGVAEVCAAMADRAIIAVREDIGMELAFWAQFPGNLSYAPRRAIIATRNFASLASLHNFAQGQAEGNHWGQAVTLLETTAAGPYHFNFHHGDLGNFTLIGPSGSGKTVVINFLLAQARKFDPRIIFFDKDRGAELFLRAIGGRYDVLRPGQPSGLNPLLLEDNAENRDFLLSWLGRLVTPPGCATAATDVVRLKEAIEANMAAPPSFRCLKHFSELLLGDERPHAGDLCARLAPWWGNGERAWLFGNAEDRIDLSQRVVGFDMTRILDDPTLRTPAMMYLFHRVEQRLDGTPAIIVVDEGWKALDDDVFTSRIRDWEKTIRKRNGIVGFATQSASDALSSRIAAAIIEQAATQIFMANPKAQADDYVRGFGLTPHEFELIRSLPDEAHACLIKHGHESVVARLDLSGDADLLTILSGREGTVRRLDRVRADHGDLPEQWLPHILDAAE